MTRDSEGIQTIRPGLLLVIIVHTFLIVDNNKECLSSDFLAALSLWRPKFVSRALQSITRVPIEGFLTWLQFLRSAST